ncbi:MAG: rhomboid family intramembrane serine protease [Candidatus Eremiobacteraeota bacterium]|nr:rhomboid family intramembrane serine protease [Candidatus Eremiobacteraeota bacterium]
MIPLKDDAPRVGTPYVTYALIAVCTVVFLFELLIDAGGQRQLDRFIFQFGMVPARISIVLFNGGSVPWSLVYPLGTRFIPPAAAFVPVFTSMFLHGSWLHLIFNMLALWIFGDNVEDAIGHFPYLVLYFLSGIAAAALHTFVNYGSTVPSVGASGAIAGVMGAYFVLYPRAKVLTLVPFFFVFFVWLPAWVVLGYWFLAQFLSGAATSLTGRMGGSSGIAFWAHVGGFLGGMALVKLFPARVRRYYYG